MKRFFVLSVCLILLFPTWVLAIGGDMNFPSVPIPEAEYISQSQDGFTVSIPTTWTAQAMGLDNTIKPAVDVTVVADNPDRPVKFVKALLNYTRMIGRYDCEYLYHDTPLSYAGISGDRRAAELFPSGAVKTYSGFHHWQLYRTYEEMGSRYFRDITVAVLTSGNQWVRITFPWTHLRPSLETVQALPQAAYPVVRPGGLILDEGFETGLADGEWETVGRVSVVGSLGQVSPVQGERQLLITADGQANGYATRGELVQFMETSHSALHGAGGAGAWAKRGSAVKRRITVAAGKTFRVQLNLLTKEAAGSAKRDFAFFFVKGEDGDPQLIQALNIDRAVGQEAPGGDFMRQSGHVSFSYTFEEAGTYTIGFGVVNSGDNADASALLLDQLQL